MTEYPDSLALLKSLRSSAPLSVVEVRDIQSGLMVSTDTVLLRAIDEITWLRMHNTQLEANLAKREP